MSHSLSRNLLHSTLKVTDHEHVFQLSHYFSGTLGDSARPLGAKLSG